MKSFRRVKTINGQDYVYEIQPYYDKKTKKTKQKTKYIGKYSGDLNNAKPVRNKQPKESLCYGEFILLFSIIKKLKLDTILINILDKKDAENILAIALNKIVFPLPLNVIESWSEGTILSKEYIHKNLNIQYLNNLLKRLNADEIINKIQKEINKNSEKTELKVIYDISKKYSFSNPKDIFEYDNNKPNKSEQKQINYFLVLDKKKNLPLMLEISTGSITDVETLKNIKQKVINLGNEKILFIMNKRLFNANNLEELVSKNQKNSFIISGVLTEKNIYKILQSTDIEKESYIKTYNNKKIYVKKIVLKIGEQKINGYLYYDKKQADFEKNIFYKELHGIFEIINKKIKVSKKTIEELINEIGKKYSKYIKYDTIKKILNYNQKEIEKHLKIVGKVILLYNNINYDWYECLEEYEKKICIEESFDFLKNDFDIDKKYICSDDTKKGYSLIQFISLIIKMRLQKELSNSKLLSNNNSIKKIMIELSKIYKVYYEKEKYYITELTEKQNDILKVLNLCK
ncbi:MAG: IS1634 family transposase [Candidatus Woesearchaeota archaeon]